MHISEVTKPTDLIQIEKRYESYTVRGQIHFDECYLETGFKLFVLDKNNEIVDKHVINNKDRGLQPDDTLLTMYKMLLITMEKVIQNRIDPDRFYGA